MRQLRKGTAGWRVVGCGPSLCVCALFTAVFYILGVTGKLSGNAMRYLLQIFLYISLGESWNLLNGFMGMTSLGQQLYVGLAGYALALATSRYHLPLFAGLALGVLLCAAAALLLSRALFRMRGMYFAIASWVAAEAVSLFFLSWKYVNQGGGMTVILSPYPTVPHIYRISLCLCFAGIAAVALLLRSRTGLAMMAMRDNPEAAQAVGVSTGRTRLLVYTISAMLTGMAGGLMFLNKGTIYPDSGFSVSWTVSAVFIVIIGGSGTVEGPMIGAVVYVLLNEYLAHFPGWSNIMLGLITILVVLFLPEGMAGFLRKKLRAEIFSRRRFAEPSGRRALLMKKRGRPEPFRGHTDLQSEHERKKD